MNARTIHDAYRAGNLAYARENGLRPRESPFTLADLAARAYRPRRSYAIEAAPFRTDHASHYIDREGYAAAIVAHVYDVALDLDKAAAALGLIARVLPGPSWWNPDCTAIELSPVAPSWPIGPASCRRASASTRRRS